MSQETSSAAPLTEVQLDEWGPRQTLYESWDFIADPETFTESKVVPGALIMRGIFQRSDTKNANEREYPRQIWERVEKDPKIRKRIEERCMYGELDHPRDGRTELKRVSHIVTDLHLDDDGILHGEWEVLPTPHGKILESLARAHCKVATSSRGNGSVHKKTGKVQDDFSLDTFDAVANPSTEGAYPQIVSSRSSRFEAAPEPSARSLREAKRFMLENPATMGEDNGVKVVAICQLFEHEAAMLTLIEKDSSLSPLAIEIGRQLREKRLALEGSLQEALSPQTLSEDAPTPAPEVSAGQSCEGGSQSMAGTAETTSNDVQASILEHENEVLSSDVEELQGMVQDLLQENEALLRIARGTTERFHQLSEIHEKLDTDYQASQEVIEELYGMVDPNGEGGQVNESADGEEAEGEEEAMSREAAAIILVESFWRRVIAGEALIEELGERAGGAELLADSLVAEVQDSLIEATVNENLAKIQNPELAEKIRPMISEGVESPAEVTARFEQIMELTEAAAPAPARRRTLPPPPSRRQREGALPTRAARQRVAEEDVSHNQELVEADRREGAQARRAAPQNGMAKAVDMSKRLDRLLSGRTG